MFEAARRYISERMAVPPAVGVVLGSGLGGFAEVLEADAEIPYAEIPGWPRSTAVGHAGKLLLGRSAGTSLAVLCGRAHLYEGYTPARVVFGVRVLRLLGVRTLILTNAAGGINTQFSPGALVLIADHINLQGVNPLTGPNLDDFGPRFPDMSEVYSAELRQLAHQAARSLGVQLPEGVYAGLLGPSYETPAEIRYLRTIGADLVGMSTVQEAIAAVHAGMRVLGISCVTNMAAGILPGKLSHQEVLQTGERVRAQLIALLEEIIRRIGAQDGPVA
jgi:purine-nucleoside phosphorylase